MKYESITITIFRNNPSKSSAVYNWVENDWNKAERMEVSVAEGWEILEYLKSRTNNQPDYKFCDTDYNTYTVNLYGTDTRS